ncbi:MAG: SAM-dependent methyltransferase, partial [Candidatus Omnitrophica bacterium]|nr:SAM-dependent methyltransferase [Candidatus Omnitrophota bacterium]
GLELIEKMEKIAKKKVIIFTPNGFLPQKEYENNPWEVHRSGWTAEEMKKMGYKVIGISGWKSLWKFLRGERAEIKLKPKWFWYLILDITQFFTKNHPEKAFQILCIKEK